MAAVAREPEFNPYAAPKTDAGGAALTDYYRTDSRRFTYAELWRVAPNPAGFVVAALLKLVHIPLARSFAIACPRELVLVDWGDLPPHVAGAWSGKLREFEALGFRRIFCHSLPCVGITRESFACILLSDDRLCTAALHYVRVEARTVARETVRVTIGSKLRDGRMAATIDHRRYLNPPSDCVLHPVKPGPAAEQFLRHREWLAEIGAQPVPRAPEDLPNLVLEREQRSAARLVERGVYVRVTERELARIERRGGGETPPAVLRSPLYRFLRGAERVLVVVMLGSLAWHLASPVRPWDPRPLLFLRMGLLSGSVAGYWLVKLVQFLLKRPRRPTA